uniref:Uncharacterized protein n=1 Tax=Lactuca sativa TaxID=4236 RepID=A0A9R1UDZ5_LACSA|nr:hypothetical protein LSAT_V11C900456750 [Lactuca sativa]
MYSSDTLVLGGNGFIGDDMRTTLASPPLRRNSEVRHNQLVNDYFADDVVYVETFKHLFQMRNKINGRGRKVYPQFKNINYNSSDSIHHETRLME